MDIGPTRRIHEIEPEPVPDFVPDPETEPVPEKVPNEPAPVAP